MNVHQVVVAAAPHDAIVNHALALQQALGGRARSEIFARFIDVGMAGFVRPLAEFPAASDGVASSVDAIVYHASIGEHEVTEFLLGRPEPLVIVYHNITPAEFFDEMDPTFAGLLRAGRDELAALVPRAAAALGVSDYNAAELRALGFANVKVSPLVGATGRVDAEPDPETAARLSDQSGPVYLFVGQLLPHKRVDFLIGAFHILRTYLEPDAVLVLAGAQRMPACTDALQQFVAELALPDVWMTGTISDSVMSAYYRGADVFVTATEHEGFCVPLVEATTCGLPVIARRFAAVPDTLGDAGLLLEPDDGMAVFAEAMHTVSGNEELRAALAAASRRRAEELREVDAAQVFLDHLTRALG